MARGDEPDGAIVFVGIEALTITRKKSGKSWRYRNAAGKTICDRAEIERLNRVALPPAYGNALFCPDPLGHIQAIGIDARKRRQYRYHPGFRAAQEAAKFDSMAEFGAALPKLRRQVERDIARAPASRMAVLAAVVRVLDLAFLRVGNAEYARTNKSFGITTLRNRHAHVIGHSLQLQYRGKSGVLRSIRLSDRALIRIVRRCQDLPGQNLFQYDDGDGSIRPVTSSDVNEYIGQAMGLPFTAKHFRTWHASVLAFQERRSGASDAEIFRHVAAELGNTAAVARKSYIHPQLLNSQAEMPDKLPRAGKRLSAPERGLLEFLAQLPTGNSP